MSLLRPNAITVERKSASATSNAGDTIAGAPVTVIAALPAFVDVVTAPARIMYTRTGGPTIAQTHTAYIDGTSAAGKNAGDVVSVALEGKSFEFVVAPNGVDAFADIRTDDRVTDERGTAYLVLEVICYYGVKPSMQVHLAEGQAWA